MKKYSEEEAESLKEQLQKDMDNLAIKHGIVFIYGTVIEHKEGNGTYFLGACANGKKGISPHDLIDCFESASRLYQSMRENMKNKLNHIFT